MITIEAVSNVMQASSFTLMLMMVLGLTFDDNIGEREATAVTDEKLKTPSGVLVFP